MTGRVRKWRMAFEKTQSGHCEQTLDQLVLEGPQSLIIKGSIVLMFWPGGVTYTRKGNILEDTHACCAVVLFSSPLSCRLLVYAEGTRYAERRKTKR
jgi:hypothetical protein